MKEIMKKILIWLSLISFCYSSNGVSAAPRSDLPNCREDEVATECNLGCEATCEKLLKGIPEGSCQTDNCKPGCLCKDGLFHVEASGKCVVKEDCLSVCKLNLCQNGGTCTNDTCQCAPGFTGILCQHRIPDCKESQNEIVAKCEEKFCARDCRDYHTTGGKIMCHLVACVDGPPTCACKPGLFREEESGKCIEPEECPAFCKYDLCQNGGTCSNNSCKCTPEFTGRFCERTIFCESNPCQNGGYCRDGKCSCDTGFTGTFCEAETSCPYPCLNGSSCTKNICVCNPGYTGTSCETKAT